MALPGPESVLRLTSAARPAPEAGQALALFARFLLLHLAVRDLVRALEGGDPLRVAWATGYGLCLLVSLRPTWLWPSLGVALALSTWKWIWIFPANSNHFFLEWLCLTMLFVGSRSEGDAPAALAALRWVPVLVLFWSGVAKLIHGTYFNGAFLASTLSSRSFAFVFGFLMPESELQRLLATQPPGPYAFDSWPAIVVSNGIWVGEIAVAFLLLLPRTRILGVVAALGLVSGIEVGARELLFGTLMLNLLAFFLPTVWSVRALGLGVVGYAFLLLVRGWLAPDWVFN